MLLGHVGRSPRSDPGVLGLPSEPARLSEVAEARDQCVTFAPRRVLRPSGASLWDGRPGRTTAIAIVLLLGNRAQLCRRAADLERLYSIEIRDVPSSHPRPQHARIEGQGLEINSVVGCTAGKLAPPFLRISGGTRRRQL
jgi:hypothetical protein